jgi:hypothetical protein
VPSLVIDGVDQADGSGAAHERREPSTSIIRTGIPSCQPLISPRQHIRPAEAGSEASGPDLPEDSLTAIGPDPARGQGHVETDPRRLEQGSVTNHKSRDLQNPTESNGALSGAQLAETVQSDADLVRIVAAWPNLSQAVKTTILAIIRDSMSANE